MKLTPILTGATMGAIALALLASPAQAECGSYQAPAAPVHVTNASYGHAYGQANVNTRRLNKKRRRMVRRLMNRFDYNGDGYISRREARRSRDMRHKFRRIDQNRDGYIARGELNRHLKRVQRRAQRQAQRRVHVNRW